MKPRPAFRILRFTARSRRLIPVLFSAAISCTPLMYGCGEKPAPAPGSSQPPVTAPTAAHAVTKAPAPVPKPAAVARRIIPAEFEHAGRDTNKVAMTFDAGSDARAVPIILQILAAHHARATFFLTGQFCKDFPRQARAIADAGMELGNHSYSHPHFPKLTDAQGLDEINRAEAAIKQTCGRGARPLFRFPYGDDNGRTLRMAARAGYQTLAWSLDSLDSVGHPKSRTFVADRIISKIRPGYITLMHVSCPESAYALPAIFDYLDHEHLQQVPVSELLQDTLSTSGTQLAQSPPRRTTVKS